MARNDALKMGELTDSAYYILLSLLEAKHGYLIMKTIEEVTEGRIAIGPASLYTTLKKLLTAEYIEALGDEGGQRKTYITTDKGIELLKKEVQRRREMVSHAEILFKDRGGI